MGDHVSRIEVLGRYSKVTDALSKSKAARFGTVVGGTGLNFTGAIFQFYLPLIAAAPDLVRA